MIVFNYLTVMGLNSFKLKQLNSNLLLLSVLVVNNMHKLSTNALVLHNENIKPINDALDYKYYDVKEKREMKRAIIQGLGLKQTVDVKKVNVSQEEYSRMYNVYLRYIKDKLASNASDNRSIPRFHEIHQKEHQGIHERHGITHLLFDGQYFDEGSVVDHASLRLLAPPSGEDMVARIQIHQVISHGGSRKRHLVEAKNIYLSARDSKWCEFDVSSAVKKWLEDGADMELHLEIVCQKCMRKGFILKPLEPAVINLLLNTDSSRDRRSLDHSLYYRKDRKTDCQKNSKKCCRQEMNFDLEKLGFNYIIQPKKFDAGICKGRCPPYYNAAHNHAVLQGIMWKKNKTATPRVCCAPSKLTHLEVLTVDEEDPTKLTVKDLANMVVLECACS